jgi:hypothetical protein
MKSIKFSKCVFSLLLCAFTYYSLGKVHCIEQPQLPSLINIKDNNV